MDFGSTHVYAGTPDPNPYYSPIAIDSSFESLHNSLSPKNRAQEEPLYESVPELMKNRNQQNNQPIYDPVYESSNNNTEYDEVPRETLPNYVTQQPVYNEAHGGHVAAPPPPVISRTVGLKNANEGKSKHPPKKSLSTSMLHKAKKLASKPSKSIAFLRDSSKPPPLPKPNTATLSGKPLPEVPNMPASNNAPPRLPPPRLPPKPPQFSNSLARSESSSSGGSHSYVDELMTLQSPQGSSNEPLNAPLTPQQISTQFKPLYPSLLNHYQTTDGEQNDAVVPSLGAVTTLNQMESCIPSAPPSSTMKSTDGRSQPQNEYASADTNIVSVKLGILEQSENSKLWPMPPVKCEKCEGVLLHHAFLAEVKSAGYCRFCHSQNARIPDAVLPLVEKESDVTYMISQDGCAVDDPIIVFCIDTSGSMCVTSEVQMNSKCFMSRMQGVKEGILNQLRNLKMIKPRSRAAVVTFNNLVTCLGDGSPQQYIALTDAQLFDADYIKAIGASSILPGMLSETFPQLSKAIDQLKEHGGTALGPALLLSVAVASKRSGSQVIVCTDGRANVGIGSLETESDYKMCHNFYKCAYDYAAEMGIMVSILSIEGTDCRLVELGKVADKTAGKVKIVNANNLSVEFNDMVFNSLMATNLSVSIVAQNELYFNDAQEKCSNLAKNFVGNATSDTEVTFKYGLQDNVNPPKDAMFQLQIQYRLQNGCTYLRVLTQSRPVTESQMVAEEGLNPAVVGTYASQLASKLVLDGEFRDAKLTTKAHKSLIHRAMSIRSTAYSSISRTNSVAKSNKNEDKIYGSVCYQMDSINEEIKKVAKSLKPATNVPPLPLRQYELVNYPTPSPSLSRSSSISLSLPDVPDTPLTSRKEAVENCPDDVASNLYKYRNACGKMFAAS